MNQPSFFDDTAVANEETAVSIPRCPLCGDTAVTGYLVNGRVLDEWEMFCVLGHWVHALVAGENRIMYFKPEVK